MGVRREKGERRKEKKRKEKKRKKELLFIVGELSLRLITHKPPLTMKERRVRKRKGKRKEKRKKRERKPPFVFAMRGLFDQKTSENTIFWIFN